VVGDVPMNALSAKAQSPQSIQAAASRAGVSQNVRFLGSLTDEDLEMAYRSASVHVFPVREIPGDPEGFGMVAVEAAANGLATVAFATGGVVDAVQEGVSGHLVAAGDYAAFAIAVERVIDDENAGLSASCVEFARTFAWPNFGEKLCERMQELAPLRGMKGGGEHGA
jgi:phosphatidylinositol alpha-1,6-mannosyltransferase